MAFRRYRVVSEVLLCVLPNNAAFNVTAIIHPSSQVLFLLDLGKTLSNFCGTENVRGNGLIFNLGNHIM